MGKDQLQMDFRMRMKRGGGAEGKTGHDDNESRLLGVSSRLHLQLPVRLLEYLTSKALGYL